MTQTQLPTALQVFSHAWSDTSRDTILQQLFVLRNLSQRIKFRFNMTKIQIQQDNVRRPDLS